MRLRRDVCRAALGALVGILILAPVAAHGIPEGPSYPSPEWFAREVANFSHVGEAPAEQASDPLFTKRLGEQSLCDAASYVNRDVADPSWLLPPQLNPALCTMYTLSCAGDPFRYPEAVGADGSEFYTKEAVVTPVVFYDQGCARISGRVWQPRGLAAGATLPAVVIENGGDATEAMYWWAAELLVRNGYVVMTFDPRGQGLSDQQTPNGDKGNTDNPPIYWTGLIDAIDFFRSTPANSYPHNLTCAASYPTPVTHHNPAYAAVDPDRLGIAGHSHGAFGVSVVQGYGAPGADAWPGKLDTTNPVKAMVAWDGLTIADGTTDSGAQDGLSPSDPSSLTMPSSSAQKRSHSSEPFPNFGVRVPSMGIESEYGLYPRPYSGGPPDPEAHKGAFNAWKDAGIPVFDVTIQGSSHYEFSLVPGFPASSWCPRIANGACSGGWGNPIAQYYTLAWFDRWLKNLGEPGYATADSRLLDDAGAEGTRKMSFYYRSARAFPDRNGLEHDCSDIRAGCADQ